MGNLKVEDCMLCFFRAVLKFGLKKLVLFFDLRVTV